MSQRAQWRIGWGRGLVGLILTSVVLLTSVIVTFATLGERNRSMDAGIRDNAVWAAYQFDREVIRLQSVLEAAKHRAAEDVRDEIGMRFDILYSRIGLLWDGDYLNKLGADGDLRSSVASAKRQADHMALLIDGMQEGLKGSTLQRLHQETSALRKLSESIFTAFNSRQAAIRVAERDDLRRTYNLLMVTVGGLTLTLCAMVAMLAMHIRRAHLAHEQLEQLSQKHVDAAAAADAGNRAKSAFLAMMSHEIRTPLNGIIGTVDLLESSRLNPDQSLMIQTVRESSDALLQVLNDVLDLSKLESGTLDLELREFDLAEVIESVRSITAPRVFAKSLSLELSYPPLSIVTDPARLRQVLLNLVGNAVKFTDQGRVCLNVLRLPTENGCDWLHFEVIDTGIGISDAALPRLFKEFSQVDASIGRRFGGTGLGLAICKHLVGALGGEIGVETREGEGSRFWFRIPVDVVAESAVRTPMRSSAVQFASRSGRILLVEDNPTNQRVAAGLLEQMGLEVALADDGGTGIDRLLDDHFDLVLMDMQMPVMDGLEATRTIRAMGGRFRDLPIIGFTANAFVSDRKSCLAAGMNDFIAKPVTRAKLGDVLQRWFVARPLDDSAPEAGAQARASEIDTRDGNQTDVIDRQRLSVLRDELGEAAVEALIEGFWSDADEICRTVAKAKSHNDYASIRSGLHTLKGAASSVGLSGIALAASQAMRAVDEGRQLDLAAIDSAILRARSRETTMGLRESRNEATMDVPNAA